jgi:DNA gyrase subunit A
MEVVGPDDALLVVSRQGYGKLVHMNRFRRQGRGGLGTRAFKASGKAGLVAGARVVNVERDDEVMLVSTLCQVFRTSIREVSFRGRTAGGVIIWRPEADDEVASIACLPEKEESAVTNGTTRPGGAGKNHAPKDGNGTGQ